MTTRHTTIAVWILVSVVALLSVVLLTHKAEYEQALEERDAAIAAYEELKQSRRLCYGLGKSRQPDGEVYGDWCVFSYRDVLVPLCTPNVSKYELKLPEEAWEPKPR